MTADPEAVTRVLAEHRPLIETPTFAGGRITGCTCGCSSDAAEYREHLASVLASLPDDRLAEAEAKVRAVEALCAEAEANPAFYDRHHWPPYVYTSKLRAALSGGDAP